MKGRIWTVPNQITFLRLCILPFFLIFVSYEKYKWALLILVIAGLSDGIDGLIARTFNQSSSLGAYLDPIADKLLLSSSFIVLAFDKQIAWWFTILVLSRDLLILIVAAVIILASGYHPFPPSIYGKVTTFSEIILVFSVVLEAAYPAFHLDLFNRFLIYFVFALCVISGVHYSFTVARRLNLPSQPL